MNGTIKSADVWDLPETDSECPWCGENLRQGAELRMCPDCPFDAMCREDLKENPPYRIRAYADWLEEVRKR